MGGATARRRAARTSDGAPFAIPIVATHPGFLRTDLHRGQGLWMDVAEAIGCHFAGCTEEECGRREVALLCAVGDKRREMPGLPLLTIVGNFGHGRRTNEGMRRDVDAHGDWLWDLLLLLESGGDVDGCED